MATFARTTPHHAPARGFSFLRAFDVWRQRQHLRRLDDAALNDIGLMFRDR
jgi:uncharacterized protein YjiS (DUF1127 family)